MMNSLFAVLSLLAVAKAAVASPVHPIRARTPYEVKETHLVPRKWKQLDRAPADHLIDLQIGVKQSNFAELERHLYEGMGSPSSCLFTFGN
jgi:tripeptidyl-peptidase-1